uniref:Uncharacterized protein n=1 Tax=Clytia hemisphaerica TaxID=252671 RepID=A0A7M5TVR3_9CNID|eukprot:TCONS_00060983-protein
MSINFIKTFNDFHQLLKLHHIQKVCLFIGNGPKLQYKDLDAVKLKTSHAIETIVGLKPSEIVKRTESEYQKCLVLYGGDTFIEDKPDLGAVIHYVKKKYNPILVSVQCWKEFDEHVDYVWTYPEQISDQGRVIYGGFDEKGKPVGGTSVYLSEEIQKMLTAVFNVDARGRVGSKERDFSVKQKLNVVNIEALPKYSF